MRGARGFSDLVERANDHRDYTNEQLDRAAQMDDLQDAGDDVGATEMNFRIEFASATRHMRIAIDSANQMPVGSDLYNDRMAHHKVIKKEARGVYQKHLDYCDAHPERKFGKLESHDVRWEHRTYKDVEAEKRQAFDDRYTKDCETLKEKNAEAGRAPSGSMMRTRLVRQNMEFGKAMEDRRLAEMQRRDDVDKQTKNKIATRQPFIQVEPEDNVPSLARGTTSSVRVRESFIDKTETPAEYKARVRDQVAALHYDPMESAPTRTGNSSKISASERTRASLSSLNKKPDEQGLAK